MFKPKDFVATEYGLVFAVVSDLIEKERVLCFLRYAYQDGRWRKVGTDQANVLLAKHCPHYLFHSETLDADLHAVPLAEISRHYQPRQRVAEMMSGDVKQGAEQDCRDLCRLLEVQGVDLNDVGVTGSLLPGFQNDESDIDLVFYGREVFQQARKTIQFLLEQGCCQSLTEDDWLASYQRRDCDLSLQEYTWHEQRKFNKTIFKRRKVDLNLIVEDQAQSNQVFTKSGKITVRTRITDDRLAFDYPAQWRIDHEQASRLLCFTATYTGQAQTGELVEISGQLEEAGDGSRRIVVGSSREARGEYIKVLNEQ